MCVDKPLVHCCLIITVVCTAFSQDVECATYPFRQWILTNDDQAYNESLIAMLPDFNINYIQLSHQLIMNIDELNDDPARRDRLRGLAELAHQQGAKALVWAHELNIEGMTFCFDLNHSDMLARQDAYRQALLAAPEIDGVMLMFGSSPVEIWQAVPSCTGPWSYDMSVRIYNLIQAIARVVIGELDKELWVRTFIHFPIELEWLTEALMACDHIPLMVMSKAVPNDFEPYYPPNPALGRVGNHQQILELDSAGEYWGKSNIPFCEAGYFRQRFNEAADRAPLFAGAACRVDRYHRHAFGTPNQMNIFFMSQLCLDSRITEGELLDAWIADHYGLQPGSWAAGKLASILQATFDVGRKMYYVKGEWAFTKGSELPESIFDTDLARVRSISKWDPDYQEISDRLLAPDVQTLLQVMQEKQEAIDLARRNLDALPSLGEYLDANDYLLLETQLRRQWFAARAWALMANVVFGYRCRLATGDPRCNPWIKWSLLEMEDLEGEIRGSGISDPFPADPDDIRTFVDNTWKIYWFSGEPVQPSWLYIYSINMESIFSDKAVISFYTISPCRSRLHYGIELPDYGSTTEYSFNPSTFHRHTISQLEPDSRYVFCIEANTLSGEKMLSGDFIFWTKPSTTQPTATPTATYTMTPTMPLPPTSTPTSTPSPTSPPPLPIIYAAGYLDTRLDAQSGGMLRIAAIAKHAQEVHVYYNSGDTSLRLELVESIEDMGFFSLDTAIPPPISQVVVLIELVGFQDSAGFSHPYPYLNVGD